MEYAHGNYGLLKAAMDYGNDTAAPVVDAVVEADGITPVYSVRFKSTEAASIYYTTDGSTPTTASTEWKPNRARALPLPLQLPRARTSSGSRPTSRATCRPSRRRCSGGPTPPAPSAAPSAPR